MIYGYEQPVQMPTMDIYSTDLMKMYVAGLQGQYENARQDLKEFKEKYGNFYSSVPGATEAYYNEGLGKVMKALADGYDLRSAEGRSYIQNIINSVDVGKLKALERQKEDYDNYWEARRQAEASGKTNGAYEDWRLRNAGLDRFSAMNGNNVADWSIKGPQFFQSLHELSAPEFEKLSKDNILGQSERDSLYDVVGQKTEDREQAASAVIQSLQTNPQYGFFLEQAYMRAASKKADGEPVTPQDTLNELQQMIYDENPRYTKEEINQRRKMNYDSNLDYNSWVRKQQYEENHPKSNGKQEKDEKGTYPLFEVYQGALSNIQDKMVNSGYGNMSKYFKDVRTSQMQKHHATALNNKIAMDTLEQFEYDYGDQFYDNFVNLYGDAKYKSEDLKSPVEVVSGKNTQYGDDIRSGINSDNKDWKYTGRVSVYCDNKGKVNLYAKLKNNAGEYMYQDLGYQAEFKNGKLTPAKDYTGDTQRDRTSGIVVLRDKPAQLP